ncbi:YdcF family protein [Sediminibacterium sp. C3]|uniref:YdcF family protein n=1 Tax=Sediminibacterium sp. C3 TaxID=1267211 RepID=UPI00047AD351|nr:YdcF family protein [Sediminibacterium sp. C3]
MIYLHKILPVFVMPIMLIIYLLIFALWNKKRWPIYTAIICLYIFSTPIFASNFFKLVEGSEVRKTPKDMPNADAIVVLSGMINQVKSTEGVYPEWGDPDRFFGAIELFKAGKAPKLIFTGGKMPWDTTKLTEGEILKLFAKQQGISDSAILLTGNVENTADEAKAVRTLIGRNKKIILVTSAYHMPRSKMLFAKQGFWVVDYSVDFKVDRVSKRTFIDYLPDADSFRLLNSAYRELIGRFIYLLV